MGCGRTHRTPSLPLYGSGEFNTMDERGVPCYSPGSIISSQAKHLTGSYRFIFLSWLVTKAITESAIAVFYS